MTEKTDLSDMVVQILGEDSDGVPIVDFDHNSVEHGKVWKQNFELMREKCPFAKSENWGGFYVLSEYEDIVAVARNWQAFSSSRFAAGRNDAGVLIPGTAAVQPTPDTVPVEMDPPEQPVFRRVLNPWMSQSMVNERWRPFEREVVTALIDEHIESGELDVIDDLIGPSTAILAMEIIGLPWEDWETYAPVYHKELHIPQDSPEWQEVLDLKPKINEMIAAEVSDRIENPRDDLISQLLATEYKGEEMPRGLVESATDLMLRAAVDTTASTTGNIFYWLGTNPEGREKVAKDPELIKGLCDEILRQNATSPAVARTVTEEVEIRGHKLKPGDRVLIAYGSGNLDPKQWDDPETVDVERDTAGALGFGMGIHRCAGIHVARGTLGVVVEEALKRMPDFTVDIERSVHYPTVHVTNGWEKMPITFAPGERQGSSFDLSKARGAKS